MKFHFLPSRDVQKNELFKHPVDNSYRGGQKVLYQVKNFFFQKFYFCQFLDFFFEIMSIWSKEEKKSNEPFFWFFWCRPWEKKINKFCFFFFTIQFFHLQPYVATPRENPVFPPPEARIFYCGSEFHTEQVRILGQNVDKTTESRRKL